MSLFTQQLICAFLSCHSWGRRRKKRSTSVFTLLALLFVLQRLESSSKLSCLFVRYIFPNTTSSSSTPSTSFFSQDKDNNIKTKYEDEHTCIYFHTWLFFVIGKKHHFLFCWIPHFPRVFVRLLLPKICYIGCLTSFFPSKRMTEWMLEKNVGNGEKPMRNLKEVVLELEKSCFTVNFCGYCYSLPLTIFLECSVYSNNINTDSCRNAVFPLFWYILQPFFTPISQPNSKVNTWQKRDYFSIKNGCKKSCSTGEYSILMDVNW